MGSAMDSDMGSDMDSDIMDSDMGSAGRRGSSAREAARYPSR